MTTRNFNDQVADSIHQSRQVETEIQKIVWNTIRSKIVWIIVGGVLVIFSSPLMGIVARVVNVLIVQK